MGDGKDSDHIGSLEIHDVKGQPPTGTRRTGNSGGSPGTGVPALGK